MELLYWHWIVLGVGLVLVELIIPSFTALWFGIGGIAVGFLLLLMPDLSMAAQISAWAVLSAILTYVWFKILKPARTLDSMPTLNEIEGEIGITIVLPAQSRLGRVRFSTPLKGFDEWDFESDSQLEVGDAVVVTGVTDTHLVMKKQ